jgi:antitoxin MazE
MRTRLIRIGKSWGVRIPKSLLDRVGLRDVVAINVEAGALVVRPVPKPRAGWAAAFRTMAEMGDDALLDAGSPTPTAWDENEWVQ